jgi:hypothetical protein
VLTLDGATTLKGLGLGLQPAERIKDTKGVSDTNLKLVDLEGGGLWGKGSREVNESG